jgi:hypothetical protein
MMMIKMMPIKYRPVLLIGLFAFTIIFIVGSAVSVDAKYGRLDLDFRLAAIYDDNVLDYSDADLDAIDDSTTSANKYGIESKDDFILNPEFTVVYKTSLAGHSLHLGTILDYYYYQENDIKRYFRIEAFFKRYFKRGLYFQGSFTHLPDYYYRNSYISGEGYFEAKFDKLILEAKLAAPLYKTLDGNVSYSYANKNFIQIFDERDIKEHRFGGELIYRPVHLWKGWGSYTYIHAIGAGADDPSYRRDTSYDANRFTLGSRLYLKGINRKSLQLAIRGTYEIVYYQTTKITSEDRYRLGRQDDRIDLAFMLDHRITRDLNIGARYYCMDKSVDLPADDLKSNLESSSNSVYFILDYSL